MASSSSSSTTLVKKFDVFLSFRGKDTRNNFTSLLRGALQRGGVNVFVDNDLKKGDEISSSLRNAIIESTISIIVFSEGYGSSRWCLEELLNILECKKAAKQVVIPVFYHIDPSHVRNQTGAFGDAFAKLTKRIKDEDLIERWRNALTEAANLSGWPLSDKNTPEYMSTWKIATDVWDILNFLSPSNYEGLVGAEKIIDYIIKHLLCTQKFKTTVHTLGIWGMGGIGKTTIAEAVFNKVRTQFEDSFFALNVREKSLSPYGLTPLRQELFSAILKDCHSNINFSFTKGRLWRKKVIIVFDDITSSSQIEFLIGDLNYLGPGSRVIITSRDKQVLRNCEVDDNMIYEMKGLSDSEAIQLFSWYAFRQNRSNIDYEELTNRIIKYTKGVPLALKVLGSFLLGKPKQVWESAVNKLELIPNNDIQKVLKVSYDGLDDVEKDIFLDIACFLKWEKKDFVIEFLNACGFYAESGISVLIDKCLVSISNDRITMHNLLQEMGWEIVRQESTKDPGERSRLWYHEDIYNVLEENTVTKAIEGLCLDMSKNREIINLDACALSKMRKLRFFKLHNSHYAENYINKVHVCEGFNTVSTQLRYLCWHGCPLKSLQSFCAKNLILLEMPYSNIEQLWTRDQLSKLKHVDLSHSKHLRKIEDIRLAPNLESLSLQGCTSLFEISPSIRFLNKLVTLNLRHCTSLRSFPTGIHLESLKKLILSCCSNLKKFPEISCNIEELYLDETAIEELPPCIENLSRLVILNIKKCSMLESLPSNICKLSSLEHLDLSDCSKLDGLPNNLGNLEALKVLKAGRLAKSEVLSSIMFLPFLVELDLTECCISNLPSNLGLLSSLESLRLGRNNFESIPTSVINLSKLSYLDLGYCQKLQFLPELPCRLQNIDAHSCTSLEASPSLSTLFTNTFSRSMRVKLSNCFRLVQEALEEIMGVALQKIQPTRRDFHPRANACLCFPGIEIPRWFTFQSMGYFLTLELPSNNLPSCSIGVFIVLCAIVEFRNYHNEGQGLVVGCDCKFRRGDGTMESYHGSLKGWECGTGPNIVNSDHVFMGYGFHLKFSDVDKNYMRYNLRINCTIEFYVENLQNERIACCNVKSCGVRLLNQEN